MRIMAIIHYIIKKNIDYVDGIGRFAEKIWQLYLFYNIFAA